MNKYQMDAKVINNREDVWYLLNMCRVLEKLNIIVDSSLSFDITGLRVLEIWTYNEQCKRS